MTNNQNRERIFISYAHKDKIWLDRVHVHLRPLVKNRIVDYWDDTKLEFGAKWKQTIKGKIFSAKIAIFLVSADFLASDFIQDEELPLLLAAAEQDGTTVLSVILSPCGFEQSPLSIYQAINPPSRSLINMKEGEQEEVFNVLSAFISTLSPIQLPNVKDNDNPIPEFNSSQTKKIQIAEDYLLIGKFEQAVQEASAILANEPNNIEALLIRARANCYLYKKEEDIICDAAKALISVKDRRDCVSLLQYAHSLFLLRKDGLAFEYVNKAIGQESFNTKAINLKMNIVSLRMRINVTLGYYANAISDADWLLTNNPNDGHAWFRKGQAYLGLKNYNEVIRCTSMAIKYIPNVWFIYDCRGEAYRSLEMNQEALNDFSKLLEEAPWYNPTRRMKAAILTDLKRYPEALSEITLALMFEPNDITVLCMRAESFVNLGDYANAKKDAETVLKYNPRDEFAIRILEQIKNTNTSTKKL